MQGCKHLNSKSMGNKVVIMKIQNNMSAFTTDDVVELEFRRDQEIDASVNQGLLSTDQR